MELEASLQFARSKDISDPLNDYRNQFMFPQHNGQDLIYLSGNSLGLQPKNVAQYIIKELRNWQELAVEGHFLGENPWLSYHNQFKKPLSELTGAFEKEVVCMNSLTVNIHLLLTSFFNPTDDKQKILIERELFPSDVYALKSQYRKLGRDFNKNIIPLESENSYLDTNSILNAIEENKNDLCLIYLSSTNYLTGQVYKLEKIAQKAKEHGITIGLDLAHGIGNIPLNLHDWGIDFACWCSYKYLNSGPGGVGGAFIHEKHLHRHDLNRLEGWWGTSEKERFRMKQDFEPSSSADSWQLSNAPIISMAAHKAALDLIENAKVNAILEKGRNLSSYLYFLLTTLVKGGGEIEILTPENPDERGSQISFLLTTDFENFNHYLRDEGIILDSRTYRNTKLFRVAPTAYNSYEDLYRFYECLANTL